MSKYIALGLWLLLGLVVLIGMINEGENEVEDLRKWYEERIDNE